MKWKPADATTVCKLCRTYLHIDHVDESLDESHSLSERGSHRQDRGRHLLLACLLEGNVDVRDFPNSLSSKRTGLGSVGMVCRLTILTEDSIINWREEANHVGIGSLAVVDRFDPEEKSVPPMLRQSAVCVASMVPPFNNNIIMKKNRSCCSLEFRSALIYYRIGVLDRTQHYYF